VLALLGCRNATVIGARHVPPSDAYFDQDGDIYELRVDDVFPFLFHQALSNSAVVSCRTACHSSFENRRRMRPVATAPKAMLATNNVRNVNKSVKNAS
jgi:hypothetical protein